MMSLQARITQRDREKHSWSSNGNTKVTRNQNGKITNVSFGLLWHMCSFVDFILRVMLWVFHPEHALRSGGPKLKSTQSYPTKFCARVCTLHKTWCLETWPNLLAYIELAEKQLSGLVISNGSSWSWAKDTKSLPAIPDSHQLQQGPHNFVPWWVMGVLISTTSKLNSLGGCLYLGRCRARSFVWIQMAWLIAEKRC